MVVTKEAGHTIPRGHLRNVGPTYIILEVRPVWREGGKGGGRRRVVSDTVACIL